MAYHTETAGANQGRVLAPFMSISFLLFIFLKFIFILCVQMCVFMVCARAHYECARSQEDIGFSGAGVTGSC